MRMRTWRSALGALALVVTAAGASGAQPGGTTIGATPASAMGVSACVSGATFWQDTVGDNPTYTTTAGVITAWSVMPTADLGSVQLEIGREAPNDTYTFMATSGPETLTGTSLNTFRTRIPVATGDRLGLYLPQQTGFPACVYASGTPGDTVRFLGGSRPTPAVGSSEVTDASLASTRVDISALIEPDADGDGYGDVTQDACPTLANSHTDCTAPETSIIKPGKVTAHGKRAKVTIVFYASEAGTRFTCTLDGGHAAACSSPFRAKVKPGRHTFTVVATDAVGNVEHTPATISFKVKKARRH